MSRYRSLSEVAAAAAEA
jgi:hypothetical protein